MNHTRIDPVLLEVLWTRHQDQDNITSICIRQMIFGQYEADGQDIETDILKLLHNPSRFATADLIQHFHQPWVGPLGDQEHPELPGGCRVGRRVAHLPQRLRQPPGRQARRAQAF